MTREEALQILRYEMQTHIASEVELHIAMGMAIEALSAEAVQGDLISRHAVIQLIYNSYYNLAESSEDVDSMIEDVEALPSTGPKRDDENEIKFFYVESIDDYWIGGVRIDNFYYATWWNGIGFVWSHSRYLPWGEHIVDEKTLWKEHTYPSEPKEMPFTEWICGFVKKYFTGAYMRGEQDD